MICCWRIHLELRLRDGMLILVECSGSDTHVGTLSLVAELRRSSTIADLKAKICLKEGFFPHQQRLIFEGKKLEDNRTLAYYGIRNGQSINCEVAGQFPRWSHYAPNYVHERKKRLLELD